MEQTCISRRNISSALATVAGLTTLDHWVRPLIKVVAIPAHAQTSSNMAPTLSIQNTSPEIFEILISDDKSSFEYSIEVFDREDFFGNLLDPPVLERIITGNSGTDTSVTVVIIVLSPSSAELRATVTDSDAEQVTATFIAITP